jgi:hypothetical protein
MSAGAMADEVRIRPSWNRLRTHLLGIRGLVVAGIGLLLVAQIAAFHNSGVPSLMITTAALLGVVSFAVIWHGLYVLNADVFIDGERLCWRTRTGRLRCHPRSDIKGVAFRSIRWASGTRSHDVVLIYDGDRHCLVRLPREYWSDQELTRMHRAISRGGAPTGPVVTARELGAEFPGAVAWWEQHNVVTGLLLACALIVVGTLLIEYLSK